MRAALIDPLVNIAGTGPKVVVDDPCATVIGRRSTAGEVGHDWSQLHRDRQSGPRLFCIELAFFVALNPSMLMDRVATRQAVARMPSPSFAAHIDAREFNAEYPACFPRWVQFSIWWFSAADGWSICNSVQIDDRRPCEQVFCPAFSQCEKIAPQTICLIQALFCGR